MSRVLILKGLPASGKSTYAKELVAKGGWKRVNKDDLRVMLDNGKWSKANEKLVLSIRDLIIVEALSAGMNVVVDDTNLHPKHEQQIRELTASFKPDFETKFFDIPVEECIKRDLQRPVSVGEKVIRRMYRDFLEPKIEPYVAPTGVPKAIICDIDGTLAHMTGRSPYDWKRVGEDTIDTAIKHLLMHMDYLDHKIILVSGRDSSCREETEKWLADNYVVYDMLLMRTEGDKRSDTIIKQEIFDQYIRGEYNIKFVLDDRNRVVDMWRSLGLKCLQVADGDF